MIPKEQITTVILAGGESQRMGRDKALLAFQGQTFIERILQVAKEVTSQTIIIANKPKYDFLKVPIYPDLMEDCGPVGGIYTAMQVVETPYLLVLSCDIPLLNRTILEYLIQESNACDANILTTEGRWQALTAIYHTRTRPIFKKALDTKTLKLRSLLSFMSLQEIDCPKALISCLSNINTPDDLKKMKDGYKN